MHTKVGKGNNLSYQDNTFFHGLRKIDLGNPGGTESVFLEQ